MELEYLALALHEQAEQIEHMAERIAQLEKAGSPDLLDLRFQTIINTKGNPMELRNIVFPYCIDRLKDGRYIVLNRNYKPLGISTKDWVDYETHPSALSIKLTEEQAASLSWNGSTDLNRIYLFSDVCPPTGSSSAMNDYQARLSLLMTLKLS